MATDLQKRIDSYCKTAIENAERFGKKLDFSEKSITDVEEILNGYSKDEEIWSMAYIWGAYIGEVMRRNIGPNCLWTDEKIFDKETPHLKNNKSRAFPIDKAWKRIMNGPEDSIISFYKIIILTIYLHFPFPHISYSP